MIKPILSLGFATLALLSSTLATGASDDTPSGTVEGTKISVHPEWFKESFLDIAADVEEAGAGGKHVILFMEMNGCPYCYKMNEENFKHAPYRDFIQENFDVIALNIRGDREVALNADTSLPEKQLAGQLGVRYTPTVVFLNLEGERVAQVNGYRNVEDFKQVLDFVQQKAYENSTLSEYLDQRKDTERYAFRAHPQFMETSDLHSLVNQPLALLFEDSGCVACDAFHDGHLAQPEVREALKRFAFVRLDALSEAPIIDVQGKATTPKAYAAELGIDYRPGLVLFDKGKEIARIESMLYPYHFLGILEYVGERHYEKYPNSPFDYINTKTAAILQSGKNVNIAE